MPCQRPSLITRANRLFSPACFLDTVHCALRYVFSASFWRWTEGRPSSVCSSIQRLCKSMQVLPTVSVQVLLLWLATGQVQAVHWVFNIIPTPLYALVHGSLLSHFLRILLQQLLLDISKQAECTHCEGAQATDESCEDCQCSCMLPCRWHLTEMLPRSAAPCISTSAHMNAPIL